MNEWVTVVVFFIKYFGISQENARSHVGNYSWLWRLAFLYIINKFSKKFVKSIFSDSQIKADRVDYLNRQYSSNSISSEESNIENS
jgi:hypothetical protein